MMHAHFGLRSRLRLASMTLASIGLAATALACGTEIGENVPGEDLEYGQSASAAIGNSPTTTSFSGRSGTRVVNLDRPVSTNDALIGVTGGSKATIRASSGATSRTSIPKAT